MPTQKNDIKQELRQYFSELPLDSGKI